LEPSVVDRLYDFLAGRGVPIPPEARSHDIEEPLRPSDAVQEALLEVYRTRPEMVFLFEALMDFDEGIQEWRYRHVKLVERTIGAKQGTGGSSGMEFLKASLFKPLFPDLWAVRHRM
jgi:tryptophan 2,3-dioxygenase